MYAIQTTLHKIALTLQQQLSALISSSVSAQNTCERVQYHDFAASTSAHEICRPTDAPSWKQLHALYTRYYALLIHHIWPTLLLALQHCYVAYQNTVEYCICGSTQLAHWTTLLASDPLFMFAIKFCALLLFLFLMHWIKSAKTHATPTAASASVTLLAAASTDSPLTIIEDRIEVLEVCALNGDTATTPASCITPTVTRELVCDFNFVTPSELRAALEAANQRLLEIEEERRRKRITKKRKCVSAGPILIAIRSKKTHNHHHHHHKHKKAREEDLKQQQRIHQQQLELLTPPNASPARPIYLSPSKEDDNFLPVRMKPLAVGGAAYEIEVDAETEADIVSLMCVCVFVYVRLLSDCLLEI